MAVAAQKNVASLMRKTLDRQAAVARMKFKIKKGQLEQIILSYVRDRNVGPYNELVKILKDFSLTDDNFKVLFEDSLLCVVLMGRELSQLVDVLCNVDWISRSEDLVELYSKFLLGLITGHVCHCPKVMMCLIKLFKDCEGTDWDHTPPEETVCQWSNIHTVIAQIVSIMPMTSELLMQTMVDHFPYFKAGCYANRAYVHNLIWISKYIPSLREQIMAAIINRMIEMDVNIVDRAKQTDIFDMEVDEPDNVTDTLDSCMLEMLHWLEDERDPVLNVLCNVFERIILPTHGIRHIQFLLLYTISISQQSADRVLNNLWKVAAGLHGISPGALSTRRTAASHLAGLLARCVRVPNTRLIHFLKVMTDWCHSYITATQESTSASDNAKVHGAFYAVCHAIFYLVAFKSHHLFMCKENINFVESLNLARLVTCALNPLRTCPVQVSRAFSATTRNHQLVYCGSVLERNARQTLHSDQADINDWFPYDPYTLPRSGKIIWPLCIDYKDWPKDGEDETQYSGMKKKYEADEDDFLMMASPSQKLASSLSNCISPGFKTSNSVY